MDVKQGQDRFSGELAQGEGGDVPAGVAALTFAEQAADAMGAVIDRLEAALIMVCRPYIEQGETAQSVRPDVPARDMGEVAARIERLAVLSHHQQQRVMDLIGRLEF